MQTRQIHISDSQISMRLLTHSLWGVCQNVEFESLVTSIADNKFDKKVNTTDNAKLEISAHVLSDAYEMIYPDKKVTHSDLQSCFHWNH